MKTKYTIIICLLLLFFVNVVVADLPTKTVFNPYGGHLQLIPNTSGIFSNTSALILALQGNDSVINNSIIALQGNDSVINNSIIALQNNDTVINASILQLQNNDTMDRSYVNNTFLPLAGGNLTGNVVALGNFSIGNNYGSYGFSQNLSDVYPGGKQYSSLVSYSTTDGSYVGLTQNAYFNTTEVMWYQMNKTRGSIIFQILGVDPITNPGGNFSYQMWGINANPARATNQIDYSEFKLIYTSTDSVFELNQNIQLDKLSGSGNAYACIDSTGKVYRSATACV